MSGPEPQQHPAWQGLEPSAITLQAEGRARSYAPGEHAIELSKAISLKRIADALDLSRDDGVAHTVWLMAMQGVGKR